MMNSILNPRHRIGRRTFLRGTGVALALPLLDAMIPSAFGKAPPPPRRMVVVFNDMGFLPENFFPQKAGKDFPLSPYLELIGAFRKDFTVFSGVSHPQVDGGHQGDLSFLTAAPHPGRDGFRNTISLDQFVAERIGSQTRFPSLNLLIGSEAASLSWNSLGVKLPPENRPSALYKRMFLQGNDKEIEAQVQKLREGRSILDALADRSRQLERQVGPEDRRRLDQYFSSVREYEQQLQSLEEWEHKPKPKVAVPQPQDVTDRDDLVGRSTLMFDMVHLALQTDSSRIVTLMIQDAGTVARSLGVNNGHHNLTHHGLNPATIAELRKVEEAQFKVFGKFLTRLKETAEDGDSLLDRTMVLQGAGMGDASSHSNLNLPILLVGGGFKHGQHLTFDLKNNCPLSNLYVSLMHRLGLNVEKFGSSTGTMTGLDMV
jgi:hypothetical protein